MKKSIKHAELRLLFSFTFLDTTTSPSLYAVHVSPVMASRSSIHPFTGFLLIDLPGAHCTPVCHRCLRHRFAADPSNEQINRCRVTTYAHAPPNKMKKTSFSFSDMHTRIARTEDERHNSVHGGDASQPATHPTYQPVSPPPLVRDQIPKSILPLF